MASQDSTANPKINTQLIVDFVVQAKGLTLAGQSENEITIRQTADGKALAIQSEKIERVLIRHDKDGESFLQVNFLDGKKILLTGNLVGFRPHKTQGLDHSRIPNVVTTPDLISVIEALEDSLQSEEADPTEIEALRRLYYSVLEGGEHVGFDLTHEKAWLARLNRGTNKASA